MTRDDDDPSRTDAQSSGPPPGKRGRAPFDKPADPAEHSAIDERRGKRIRGPEPHDGD